MAMLAQEKATPVDTAVVAIAKAVHRLIGACAQVCAQHTCKPRLHVVPSVCLPMNRDVATLEHIGPECGGVLGKWSVTVCLQV
jgi:hypothetical protein